MKDIQSRTIFVVLDDVLQVLLEVSMPPHFEYNNLPASPMPRSFMTLERTRAKRLELLELQGLAVPTQGPVHGELLHACGDHSRSQQLKTVDCNPPDTKVKVLAR